MTHGSVGDRVTLYSTQDASQMHIAVTFAIAYALLVAALCTFNHAAHSGNFIKGVDDYEGP